MRNKTFLSQENTTNDDIDFLSLFLTIIEKKWTILSCIFVCVLIGAAYNLIAPPIYQADTLLQIEEKSSGVTGLGDLGEAFGTSSNAVTEIELIKSRAIIGKAVTNLNLNITAEPEYLPLIGKWIASTQPDSKSSTPTPAFLGLTKYSWGGARIEIFQLEVPQSYEGKELKLIAENKGNFSLYDEDKLVLKGNTREAIDQQGFRIQIEELIANPGTEFSIRKSRLLNTIEAYQNRIEATERGRESGIISLTLEDENHLRAIKILDEISKLYVRQNVERNSAEAAQSLEFLKHQLPQVRKELEKYEALLNEYKIKNNSVDISIETKSILDQMVELETMISEQNLKKTELERRFTKEHPSYQALTQQISQLTSERDELASRIEGLPDTQQELLRLTRDVAVTTEIYTVMLNRSQELDVLRAGTVGNVRIIDKAESNISSPVKPKKAIILAASILIGGITGIAFVLTIKSLNPGIEDPDLIEGVGLPVYASIPFSKDQEILERHTRSKHQTPLQESLLLAKTNPADLAVESLRSLRTSLHFAKVEAKNNVLMISGPSPSVGKSFVSTNLAAIVAQSGQKVLLIDADMRKGYINKIFRLPAERGLSELLSGAINSQDAIRKTEIANLDLMTRGQIPPNPSELLMHASFSSFLSNVEEQYDMVIIDTPPILAVTDAAIVGRHSGTALIVTRFGLNTPREIELTMRRFQQNDIQIKGAIFNAVEKKATAYGNYGYYNYEYKSEKS